MQSLTIGQSVIRKDAWEKVSGQAKYTADIASPELLHGVIVTSTCAHGNIKKIDCEAARAMPGVRAVITGDYYPILTGSVIKDRPPLASGKVRYYGEPVAVVVADTEAEAAAAALKVKVSYEELPTVNSPAEAIKPDAALVHEFVDQYQKTIPEVYPQAGSNVVHHVKIRKGDLQKGWGEADIVVEGSFTLPMSDHIAMETRSAMAHILADGKIIIRTSSQGPFPVRKMISEQFGRDLGNVVVQVPLVGGGFGGKASVELEYLAVMASKSVGGRKVIISSSREQDIVSFPVKLALEAKIRLGAKGDGTLTAGEYTFLVGTGAYAESSPRMTNAMAMSCTGPYKLDNVWCDALCIYTNHTYSTAFRGFGHGSMTFAVERMMDKLAAALNMDPFQIRRKNAVKPGDTTPTQVELTESNLGNLHACIDKVESLINWQQGQVVKSGDNKLRAKGMACFWKTSSSPTDAVASAVVTFNSDGSANLQVGAVEIGPSTKTTLAQILAEKLTLDINRVHVEMEVNTCHSPHHWKTVASMSTFMVGRAVEEAADDALKQLLSLAAMAMACAPEDLMVEHGRVAYKDNPQEYMEFAAIAHGHKSANGNTVGSQVIGKGSFVMPHLSPMDQETGQGKPGPYQTPGAQAVEVELNISDYSYRILKAITVLDAGKVINPKAAKGLVMGAMGMGLGLATREELVSNQKQELVNTSLRTYKVMHIGQQPEYVVDWVETPNKAGPYGARGLAEHGILGIHAALLNALSKAAGVELDQLPIYPETIWKRVQEGRP